MRTTRMTITMTSRPIESVKTRQREERFCRQTDNQLEEKLSKMSSSTNRKMRVKGVIIFLCLSVALAATLASGHQSDDYATSGRSKQSRLSVRQAQDAQGGQRLHQKTNNHPHSVKHGTNSTGQQQPEGTKLLQSSHKLPTTTTTTAASTTTSASTTTTHATPTSGGAQTTTVASATQRAAANQPTGSGSSTLAPTTSTSATSARTGSGGSDEEMATSTGEPMAAAASTLASVRSAPPPTQAAFEMQQQQPVSGQVIPLRNTGNQLAGNELLDLEPEIEEQISELIDRMSSSQSVDFAAMDTTSAPSSRGNFNAGQRQQSRAPIMRQQQSQEEVPKQQQQPAKQQTKGTTSQSGANRWTFFGARIKPLAATGNSLEPVASSSRSQQSARPQQQQVAPAAGRPSPMTGNQLTGSSEQAAGSQSGSGAASTSDQDDEMDASDGDNESDSEALLYKLMQQQQGNFLLPAGSSDQAAGPNNLRNSNGQQQSASDQSSNMLKLLKTYSHIHQVDDSDDQIRGTGTRFAAAGRRTASGPQQSTAAAGRSTLIATDSRPNNNNNNRLRHNGNQMDSPMARASHQQPTNGNQYDGSADQQPETQPASEPEGEQPDEFECPNNGIFADEASGCQAYHVCQSGAQVQQRFQCPLGTLFNNIILTCDFAHNVQCGGAGSKSMAADGLRAGAEDTLYKKAPAARKQQQQAQQQPQQQQQPRVRAPQQVIGSSNNNNIRPAVAATSQQQQSGPRPLKIGRQEPQQQAPQAAPTRTGSQQPPAANLAAEEPDDETDDEPLEPLVPVQLPPARQPQQQQPATQQQQQQPQGRVVHSPLPYNAPPPRSSTQHQSSAQHQSAHRSQYPSAGGQQLSGGSPMQAVINQVSNYLRTGNYEEALGGRDTTSFSSPIYRPAQEKAGAREASPSTNRLGPMDSAGGSQLQVAAAGGQAGSSNQFQGQQQVDSQAHSFNLVINHLTSGKQQAPQQQTNRPQLVAAIQSEPQVVPKKLTVVKFSPLPPQRGAGDSFADNNYVHLQKQLVSQQQLARIQQQQQQPLTTTTATTGVFRKQKPEVRQQQQQTTYGPQVQQQPQPQQNFRTSGLRRQQPSASRYASNAISQVPPRQQRYDSQRHQMATHLRSVYSEAAPGARQPQQPTSAKPAIFSNQQPARQQVSASAASLIDLTNDKSRTGVSSDALNDGMLLLVRHSDGHSPQQQQDVGNKMLYGKQKATSGQAIALEPALVRPNSPLDAQLFPNVQRLLSGQLVSPVTQPTGPPPQRAAQSQVQSLAAAASNAQPVTSSAAPTELASRQPPQQQVNSSASKTQQQTQQKTQQKPPSKQKMVKKVRKLRTTQVPAAKTETSTTTQQPEVTPTQTLESLRLKSSPTNPQATTTLATTSSTSAATPTPSTTTQRHHRHQH